LWVKLGEFLGCGKGITLGHGSARDPGVFKFPLGATRLGRASGGDELAKVRLAGRTISPSLRRELAQQVVNIACDYF
jgi:hypothetical protein